MGWTAVGEFLLSAGSDALKVIGIGLGNPSDTSNVDEQAVIAIEDIWSTFGAATYAIGWVLNQVKGAKQYEVPLAQHIATQLETAGQEYLSAINHLAFTILPESLKYLRGRVYGDWIYPQLQWDQRAEAQITDLYARVGQLWAEVFNFLRPWAMDYIRFRTEFYAMDQPALNVLIDWLRHPAHFGQFAAAPVAPYLIGYLSHPAQKRLRDFLTWVVLYGAEEQPDLTAGAILNILLQPAGP